MSLLDQDITRKKQVNQNKTLPKPEKKFEAENDKEYEVKAIINSAIYSKEANDQMLGPFILFCGRAI